jgi:hypothetical protein
VTDRTERSAMTDCLSRASRCGVSSAVTSAQAKVGIEKMSTDSALPSGASAEPSAEAANAEGPAQTTASPMPINAKTLSLEFNLLQFM